MNFLTGEVGPGPVFRGQGFELPLRAPDAVASVGVRPQAFRLAGDGPLAAEIDLVEPLGSETFVHFSWGSQPVVVRVPSEHTVRAGETLRFTVDAADVHRFDADGAAL